MEIERKFLVKGNPFQYIKGNNSKEIIQGYISTDPVIRIRRAGEDYYLTVKGEGHISREEFEMNITKTQFESLLSKVSTNIIEKTRYYIPLYDNLVAELDIYGGSLRGLATVEVEFTNAEISDIFVPPDWFGEDISKDARYKNNNLSIFGSPFVS